MRIKKKAFFVQVKYSDLLTDPENTSAYFLGAPGELYLSAEEISDYNTTLINRIKNFAKKHCFPLRLHAPLCKLDYSNHSNLLQNLRPLYQKVIKLCGILNINYIVAHAELGMDSSVLIGRELESAVLVWRALCNDLSRNNIKISMENHYERDPSHLVRLMEMIDLPNFKMCVDLGHFNAFSDLKIEDCIQKYPRGSIEEVHLADNKGDGDTHLALGEGNIDFRKFFKSFQKRGEKSIFVLEPRNINEAKKSISFLKKEGMLEDS